jgi:HK97 family phage prohead protease
MKKNLIDIADFHAKFAETDTANVALRLAPSVETEMLTGERVMKFVFSDGSVDRYGDTIDARGWVLESFNANPVALFAHDANSVRNVVGRARNLGVQGGRLVGEIEFMDGSINPDAEIVYQMYKGGYLNAVSVGFAPLEWSLSKDKSRPQGIDFRKQELLEISCVPIPANPGALALARAAGIDVDRFALIAAAEDAPADRVKRRSALLVRKVIGRKTKGLYDLGYLAELLSMLGMITDWAQWEAEMEGDGSNVPDMLVAVLFDLADAFSAMAAEEIAEFLAGFSDEPDVAGFDAVDLAYVAEGKTVAARCFRAGRVRIKTAGEPIVRAGRVLSAENQKKLRSAHEQICAACDVVKGVADSADVAEPDDPSVVVMNEQKAARGLRARAIEIEIGSAA